MAKSPTLRTCKFIMDHCRASAAKPFSGEFTGNRKIYRKVFRAAAMEAALSARLQIITAESVVTTAASRVACNPNKFFPKNKLNVDFRKVLKRNQQVMDPRTERESTFQGMKSFRLTNYYITTKIYPNYRHDSSPNQTEDSVMELPDMKNFLPPTAMPPVPWPNQIYHPPPQLLQHDSRTGHPSPVQTYMDWYPPYQDYYSNYSPAVSQR